VLLPFLAWATHYTNDKIVKAEILSRIKSIKIEKMAENGVDLQGYSKSGAGK